MTTAQVDPKTTDRPLARCTMCDREVDHYNIFLNAHDVEEVICWECMQREEKGFFAKRDFRRTSRRGVIPR